MKPFNNDNPRDARGMNVGQYGFHGDVKITKTDEKLDFSNMKECPDRALAYGEHTGHLHQLNGTGVKVMENPSNGAKYFEIPKGQEATLYHQEHNPVILAEGVYVVDIQKEYDHLQEIVRDVRD